MSCQLQADLIPCTENLPVPGTEQNIFDRYRAMALAVAFKRKPMGKLMEKEWFIKLMNEAGLMSEFSSPQAVSDVLNKVAKARVKITHQELDEALPALASLSIALGLNETEKLILAFLVNLNDDRNFWFDFNVQMDEITKKMTVIMLAEILQIDTYQTRLAFNDGGQLFKSGVLERCFRGGLQSLPLISFFKPSSEIDIYMFRSKTAWNDFFASKFERADYSGEGVDFSHLAEELSLIENCLLNAITSRHKGMHVLLYGPPGTGKTTLARELASRLKFELYEVKKDRGSFHESDGELRFGVYKLGQQLGSAKGDCLMLFDELEDLLPSAIEVLSGGKSQSHKGWICNSLESARIPTIWTSNSISGIDPAILRRFTFTLEVPVPPKRLRRKILDDLLEGFNLSPDWMGRTASLERLTPAMTRQLAELAQSLNAKAEKLEAVLDLWLASHLKAMGAPPLPPIKKTQAFMCDLMNADIEPNGIIEGLKKSGEGRLCLYGPPGTGKTAFAKYLAEELDVEVHLKRGSDIRSKWVGETEQNIAQMFADASRNKAVLILDEADSFLSERSGRNQRWEMNEVSEFLVQLENFQGIFCATTNRFEDLDSAFLRRFDLKIKLDYLTEEQRSMMFKKLLRKPGLRACLSAVTRTGLARLDQLTPGDFTTAQRRMRFSQQECNQGNLLSALVHEMGCKTVSQGRPIGFR
jgi:SpoVK/Ycf46/Vps4 family AAA+-type ATPase